MLLKGKTALITGSNRGIGRSILEIFAEHGANIIAHARKETSNFIDFINQVKKNNQIDITPLYFDLTDYTSMKTAVQSLMTKQTKIDILVNNAGIMKDSLFHMVTADNLHQHFEVNFFSIFKLTQYITKIMLNTGKGSVINLASISATNCISGQTVYGATKAALIAMSKSLSAELGEKGIRVNCLAPGIIHTDLINSLSPAILDSNKSRTALGRLGQTTDVASVALFLASDLSEFVTGQVIGVDGGYR